jgi:hypothetical protein
MENTGRRVQHHKLDISATATPPAKYLYALTEREQNEVIMGMLRQ